jgi:hypothetical protein
MTSTLVSDRPLGRSMTRICSGGCEHFNPVYVDGRKVAGKGRCDKQNQADEVRVGICCLWPRTSLAAASAVVA